MPEYYEFMGTKFGPRISAEVPMVDPPELISGERHIPYSNRTVLDIGGRGPRRYKATIRVAPSDVPGMMAKLGSIGDLYVAGELWTPALLVKLGGHTRTPLNSSPIWHFFEAEWTIGGNY